MKKVSFGLWEITAGEAARLTEGSQILCYDVNYDRYTLQRAGIEPVARNKRFVYYALGEPIFKR